MRAVTKGRLKERLSYYLHLVQEGARFVVTDRGRPIAEIRPLEAPRTRAAQERAWLEAAASGLVSLPRGRGFARFRPVLLGGGARASDAILEDRR